MTDSANETDRGAEAAVRDVVDRWVAAFRDRDVAAGLAVHSDDVVSFDIVPPLRYVGADQYREAWESASAAFAGPIVVEPHDLAITVSGNLAVGRAVVRFRATATTGAERLLVPLDGVLRAARRMLGDHPRPFLPPHRLRDGAGGAGSAPVNAVADVVGGPVGSDPVTQQQLYS